MKRANGAASSNIALSLFMQHCPGNAKAASQPASQAVRGASLLSRQPPKPSGCRFLLSLAEGQNFALRSGGCVCVCWNFTGAARHFGQLQWIHIWARVSERGWPMLRVQQQQQQQQPLRRWNLINMRISFTCRQWHRTFWPERKPAAISNTKRPGGWGTAWACCLNCALN